MEFQLALEGEHPEFGPVTLKQLLATWAAHDLGHLAQTARVLAKQYREAVGPWRAYLPVMDRPAHPSAPIEHPTDVAPPYLPTPST
jgi:hypothetical protein